MLGLKLNHVSKRGHWHRMMSYRQCFQTNFRGKNICIFILIWLSLVYSENSTALAHFMQDAMNVANYHVGCISCNHFLKIIRICTTEANVSYAVAVSCVLLTVLLLKSYPWLHNIHPCSKLSLYMYGACASNETETFFRPWCHDAMETFSASPSLGAGSGQHNMPLMRSLHVFFVV